jgi:hypothetical protein
MLESWHECVVCQRPSRWDFDRSAAALSEYGQLSPSHFECTQFNEYPPLAPSRTSPPQPALEHEIVYSNSQWPIDRSAAEETKPPPSPSQDRQPVSHKLNLSPGTYVQTSEHPPIPPTYPGASPSWPACTGGAGCRRCGGIRRRGR